MSGLSPSTSSMVERLPVSGKALGFIAAQCREATATSASLAARVTPNSHM